MKKHCRSFFTHRFKLLLQVTVDNKKAENNQKQDNYNCYNQPGIEFEFLFFAGIFLSRFFLQIVIELVYKGFQLFFI